MFKISSIGNSVCDECGKSADDIFEVNINRYSSYKSAGAFIFLCPNCRRQIINNLIRITPDSVPPAEPHGGKWFEIWKEDKENIIATMYKNLSADLDAGYNYNGNIIQKQLQTIDEYREQYHSQLDKFVCMTDGEVSRWCYYDLKKRGAIE